MPDIYSSVECFKKTIFSGVVYQIILKFFRATAEECFESSYFKEQPYREFFHFVSSIPAYWNEILEVRKFTQQLTVHRFLYRKYQTPWNWYPGSHLYPLKVPTKMIHFNPIHVIDYHCQQIYTIIITKIILFAVSVWFIVPSNALLLYWYIVYDSSLWPWVDAIISTTSTEKEDSSWR